MLRRLWTFAKKNRTTLKVQAWAPVLPCAARFDSVGTMQTSPAPSVTLSLEGRVALITGGSRGIGAATVRLFRQAGARVVFSYRSAQPQADALVEECGGADLCRAICQELSTVEEGQALIRAAIAS